MSSENESYGETALPLALSAAAGVLAGSAVGVRVMRTGDRPATIASELVAAGLVGGVVASSAAFPSFAGLTGWGWVSPWHAAAAVLVPALAVAVLLLPVAFGPGLMARR